MENLISNLPLNEANELFEVLVRGGEFRVERIVSHGHSTPAHHWYDQETDEWVLLLTGAARLRIRDREELVDMQPGDCINIPAHQRHRVEWTDPDQPTVWLAIHYSPPAKADFPGEDNGPVAPTD